MNFWLIGGDSPIPSVGKTVHQKNIVDGESWLVPGKIKETMHPLKNHNPINKISYMVPELWLPNLR